MPSLVFIGAFLHFLTAYPENVEFGVRKESLFPQFRAGLVRATTSRIAHENRLVFELGRAGIAADRLGLPEESDLMARTLILMHYQNLLTAAHNDWMRWFAETVPPISELGK